MKKTPSLPRHVPDVTVGDPVDGGDVIDCRVVVGEIPETGVLRRPRRRRGLGGGCPGAAGGAD